MRCEIGKENQILPYCDAIILGTDTGSMQELMATLWSYEYDFDGLSIGYMTLPQEFESQAMLIRQCMQRGSKVLLMGAEERHYRALHLNLPEIYVFSNRPFALDAGIAVHCLGFQRHLVSRTSLKELEQISNHAASLGLLTEDSFLAEAMLRTAAGVHVNASVCKESYAGRYLGNEPAGLSPEQLIQMVRYAAHSSALQLIGFDLLQRVSDDANLSPVIRLYANCIWYFLEGLVQGSYTAEQATDITFVNLQGFDEVLEFAYDSKNDKWWVRIQQEQPAAYIACTENDQREAVSGTLTDRLHRLLFEVI